MISKIFFRFLDPDVIRSMYRVHKEIDSLVTEKGKSWSDLCMKAPVVKAPSFFDLFGKKRRKKRQSDFDFSDFNEDEWFEEVENDQDPFGQNEDSAAIDTGEYFSVELYPDPYCNIVDKMQLACLELSILELWANEGQFDSQSDEAMESLTLEQVLDKINGQNKSGVFLVEKNFTNFLADVQYDSAGKIIGAKATIIRWLGQMDTSEAKDNPVQGRGEPIDQATFDFEGLMLEVMLNTSYYPEGLKSYPNVKRSFGDIAGSTILGNWIW